MWIKFSIASINEYCTPALGYLYNPDMFLILLLNISPINYNKKDMCINVIYDLFTPIMKGS